jgi:hypothetical protein
VLQHQFLVKGSDHDAAPTPTFFILGVQDYSRLKILKASLAVDAVIGQEQF